MCPHSSSRDAHDLRRWHWRARGPYLNRCVLQARTMRPPPHRTRSGDCMTDREPPAPPPLPPPPVPPAPPLPDDEPTPPLGEDEPPPSPDDPPPATCGNCGTALLGPHCYQCGQPVSGLVRHFSSLMGDFLDSVLQWDGRLPRTIGPLFARPAYLTREYFAGRRVRFVSPVRLFFTISLVTFFFAQLVISFGDEPIKFDRDGNGFDKATTVDEVIRERDEALKEIAQARNEGNANIPGVDTGLRAAEVGVRRSADARIAQLQKADPTVAGAPAADRAQRRAVGAAAAADAAADTPASPTTTTTVAAARVAASTAALPTPGAPADAPSAATSVATPGASTDADADATPTPAGGSTFAARDGSDDDWSLFDIDGTPWNAKTNPVTVFWMPAWANAQINALLTRADSNIKRMRKDPDEFKDAVLGAVPSTLFVLLPVFALLLKLFYVFKRRLYMEHLIVALHSHAFLCLALLLMFAAMAARDAIASHAGFVYGLLGWCEAALWVWMPLYLLLMQKRVYGQGWPMTLLKYAVLGQLYIFLLSFGAVFTVMFSVVWG